MRCNTVNCDMWGSALHLAGIAGDTGELVSHESSGIVDPDGMAVRSARQLCDELIAGTSRAKLKCLRAPRRNAGAWM